MTKKTTKTTKTKRAYKTTKNARPKAAEPLRAIVIEDRSGRLPCFSSDDNPPRDALDPIRGEILARVVTCEDRRALDFVNEFLKTWA